MVHHIHGKEYVWPIALTMQALTSNDEQEIQTLIDMIVNNTGDTGYCHESFDVNDDSQYTRPWFLLGKLFMLQN